MELLQTIIIVILIIVALILFIFLVADIEYPPPTVVSPFKTGSVIRIRSLANNKYLRIANCDANNPPSYASCSLTPAQGWTGCGATDQPQIVADADIEDRGINWYLSEYTGTTPTPGGNAAYIIYYGGTPGSQIMGYRIGNGFPIFLASGASSPVEYNQSYGTVLGPYFSFQLQENDLSGTTGSGIYQILNGNPSGLQPHFVNMLFCPGTKDLSLYTTCSSVPTCQPAQACPSIVTMENVGSTISTQDPLTYSFVIENVFM